MNYEQQVGKKTDESSPQKHHPMFRGLESDVTLIEKHGTGISWNNWGCNHGKY